MKKIICLFVILLSLTSSAYAADVNVQINGKIIDFTDSQGNKVNAQIINERTMVPFRKIFNELGVVDENITYTSSEEPITAKKDNVEIIIQIGSTTAKKIENGVEKTITLDSAPVIIEGRTLVPLRFIAESLGNTVGWDSANATAVIIDYNYLKNKSVSLYNFLTKDAAETNFSITRNYFDDEDSTKNDSAIVSGQIIESRSGNNVTQNVTMNFDGTNEVIKEIISEGWANIQFENTYTEKSIVSKALNDGLKKIYGIEQLTFDYSELECSGSYDASLYELFKTLCNVEESSINISTFDTLNNEFNNLLKLFNGTDTKLYTGNKNSNDIELNYFDFTKFDNIIWDDSVSRVYSFINSQIFKYDITLEELSYDYPTINIEINLNNSELNIDLKLSNEYNERIEYIVKINKI